MLRPTLLLSALLALLPAAGAFGADASVTVADKAFSPANVTISPGESVTWSWGEGGHNVHVVEGPVRFDSGFKEPGGTYARAFGAAGVYRYVCDAHPDMRGSVTVGGATPVAAPTAGPAPARPAAVRLSGVKVSLLGIVRLRASAPGRLRVRLIRDGRVVRRWAVRLAAGDNRLRLPARSVRLGRYRLELGAVDAPGRITHRVVRTLRLTRTARAHLTRAPSRTAPAPAAPPPPAPAPAPSPSGPIADDSDGRARPGDRRGPSPG